MIKLQVQIQFLHLVHIMQQKILKPQFIKIPVMSNRGGMIENTQLAGHMWS